MAIINIVDCGAVSGGQVSCTAAFKKAAEMCEKNGGGTIFVPAGKYLTGPIFLMDNTELNLEAGAVLLFSNDIEEWPAVESRWEGVKRECYASCINAYGKKNISITGHGTLDGQGKFWWDLFRSDVKGSVIQYPAEHLKYPRPKLIAPYDCDNVLIQGVTLKNSPSWTINTILCNNVTIDNVTINNPSDSPNTDGIDPESCTNVHISNCHVDVGDDCIAVKAGTEETADRVPCKNITITNCTMVHGHGGVVLGSEMSGDIVNVTISNCVFEGTDRGIRLKSRRGRGGKVEDIRVDNIVMENVFCPFIANLYYNCGPSGEEKYVWDKNPYPITEETPAFRRLHFANMTCKNVNAAAGYFYGLAEMYVEDCTFENIYISIAENAVPGMPAMHRGMENMKEKGFFLKNTKNVTFTNIKMVGVDGPAFDLEDCQDIIFTNCENKDNKSGADCFKQVNTKNITIK